MLCLTKEKIMSCKWCKEQCYVHCPESEDGEHSPDLSTVQWVDDTDYFDVFCSLCGKSASAYLGEINWD